MDSGKGSGEESSKKVMETSEKSKNSDETSRRREEFRIGLDWNKRFWIKRWKGLKKGSGKDSSKIEMDELRDFEWMKSSGR